MKKIGLLIIAVLGTVICNAQLQSNHLGLGLSFNSSGRINDGIVNSFLVTKSDITGSDYQSSSRVYSDYKIGFSTTKHQFLQVEFNILQGTDYMDFDEYSYTVSDSFVSQSLNVTVQSSLIGLRSLVRATTKSKKRFFFNFGLGIEGILAYDLDKEAYQSGNLRGVSSGSSYVRNQLQTTQIKNYGYLGIVQQAGMSFRIAKEDKNYPFNNVMIETDFQILSNFMMLDGNLHRFRTFGGVLAVVYEFNK